MALSASYKAKPHSCCFYREGGSRLWSASKVSCVVLGRLWVMSVLQSTENLIVQPHTDRQQLVNITHESGSCFDVVSRVSTSFTHFIEERPQKYWEEKELHNFWRREADDEASKWREAESWWVTKRSCQNPIEANRFPVFPHIMTSSFRIVWRWSADDEHRMLCVHLSRAERWRGRSR